MKRTRDRRGITFRIEAPKSEITVSGSMLSRPWMSSVKSDVPDSRESMAHYWTLAILSGLTQRLRRVGGVHAAIIGRLAFGSRCRLGDDLHHITFQIGGRRPAPIR